MPRSLHWFVALLISLSLFPLGGSISQARQTDDGGAYTCPTEAQDPPEGAATTTQTIRGTEAVPQGEPLVIDEGKPNERTYTVYSTGYLFEIGGHTFITPAIVLCLRVEFSPTSTQRNLLTGYFRMDTRDSPSTFPGFVDYYGTRVVNGVDQDEAEEIARGGEGPEDALIIDMSTDRDQVIPLVLDPGQEATGETELYITSGQPRAIANGDDLDWAMLVDLKEPPAESEHTSPSSAARATQASGITSGTVTEFNQPTVITLGLEKWRLNFDPAVEVRSSIAGVAPQRGQFLVIWFDQFSTRGEPLPLGNFTLQTSTGPGEPFGVRALSREGTTGLILTEYTWSPDTMSASTDYRTGIAFDIAPEDTHFVLQYRGPAQTLGNDYVVDLEFDA